MLHTTDPVSAGQPSKETPMNKTLDQHSNNHSQPNLSENDNPISDYQHAWNAASCFRQQLLLKWHLTCTQTMPINHTKCQSTVIPPITPTFK
eukprot:11406488-Ditylum_brightwellii.AAC.1